MMQSVLHNAGLKIASLVLATFSWFFVKGVTSDWRTIDGVPLEVQIRPGLAVLRTSASTVNVTVRGTREDVRQVSREDLSAVVDLTRDDVVGSIPVKLTPRAVRHSRRVQVSEVEPSEVIVNVDEMVERVLPVQPQVIGEPPPTLAIERVVTKPEVVKVRGPKMLLDSKSFISTLPIDVSGRRTSFRERVELTPMPFSEGGPQRLWVEADVRIGPAGAVDTSEPRGVEPKP